VIAVFIVCILIDVFGINKRPVYVFYLLLANSLRLRKLEAICSSELMIRITSQRTTLYSYRCENFKSYFLGVFFPRLDWHEVDAFSIGKKS
jgi:hypothetical protein